jgi:uncharacterized protein DUF6326
MDGMRSKLSTLWLFATVNYLYCDVVTLMDQGKLKGYLAGSVGGLEITPGFLLAAAVLVEIPMAMILLAHLLPQRANRWANVVAGAVMTVVQLGTLFAGTPALYYVFFSVIEIGTTAAIVWLAWSRTLERVEAVAQLQERKPQLAWAQVPHDHPEDRSQ